MFSYFSANVGLGLIRIGSLIEQDITEVPAYIFVGSPFGLCISLHLSLSCAVDD